MTRKEFASFERQIGIVDERGLSIVESDEPEGFLRQNSYYRFSGYMRYFQVAPSKGDENFRSGTTFSEIREIYELDAQLRTLILDGLQKIEISARTAFAHSEAEIHTPYAAYLEVGAYSQPPRPNETPTEDIILSELERSKEPFILRHRSEGETGASWANNVPVWAAVETFSFGTLSKAVTYRDDDMRVYKSCCSILNANNQDLSKQLRAFAHLRNRCAHYSRLWNISTTDQPSVLPKVRKKAKRALGGQYEPNSVFAVIVAMDNYLARANIQTSFLDEFFEVARVNNSYLRGITNPHKA
ncbi:Abi family protein [Corynebacterium cystitidis]|uniref:Abi family protein n=1 Tax=Corynebacterium cystitidis TaxID=35757 RepID=UPI00115FD241|nr:Abi family protein [Corynebacterium cystitidis]